MKKGSKILAFSLAAAMVFTLGACGQPSSNNSSTGTTGNPSSAAGGEEKTVVMATNAEFEPFEYQKSGEFLGIDIDISKKIAEKMGAKLSITNTSFDSLTAELSQDKADFVAAGMSYDEDKLDAVDFSDPYYEATQVIIVQKENTTIQGFSDLDGKKIGVQLGTTGDKLCTKSVKDPEMVRMNKAIDAVSDLINGRIDAVVVDNFPAEKFVVQNADKLKILQIEGADVEEYCIAVKKGDTEMLKTVNDTIKELKESGELEKIVDKYRHMKD